MRCHTLIDSKIGPLTMVAEDDAIVGLYMDVQRHRPEKDQVGEAVRGGRGDELLKTFADQLDAYFAGELTRFDLPLAPCGSGFQQRVWAVLREIPYGRTLSYGELAGRAGSPDGARAAGLACGRNPICIVIPCHRVVGSRGHLTGFGGGLNRKRQLLDLEMAASGGVLF